MMRRKRQRWLMSCGIVQKCMPWGPGCLAIRNDGGVCWAQTRGWLYTCDWHVQSKQHRKSEKRTRTSIRGGGTVGPTNRVSFSDVPVEVFADASKTACTLAVAVLDSLQTTCIKINWQSKWLGYFSKSTWGTGSACWLRLLSGSCMCKTATH